MTDDFDFELRHRLASLNAAVPVEVAGPRGVSVSPHVQPGSAARGFALGALASLVVVVLVATAVAGLTGLGPFAPAGSAGTEGAPVVSTVTDGPFELTLRSARARYATDQPVEIEASLAYRGASPWVV